MRTFLQVLVFASATPAVDLFLEASETDLGTYLLPNDWTEGTQSLLKDMRAIPDFEFAVRNHLDDQEYSYYRAAAASEWIFRAKGQFQDVDFGNSFSAPISISQAARGGYAHDRGELNFAEATGEEDLLYCASKTIEEVASAKSNSRFNRPQVLF
ncbi:hypothetical protein DL764_011044 [Monosporascus ibericus]|uniref:Uncharacterized protein n=1 Tax=Monosporascus ibericus TaxID=155417 RepID=A0A4Q4STZ0_9PEZI|nr:hypothetical protein DL764_011044 [Monosporascus ibericus]